MPSLCSSILSASAAICESRLKVILEALKRLEARFQGATPAAIDLWNKLPDGSYRPKDEESLSNYVKRYLENDLRDRSIVVNHEVEIRRGEGSGQGEETESGLSTRCF